MSRRDDRNANFLYGVQAQGQKKPRRSFWTCKPPAERQTTRSPILEDSRSEERPATRGTSIDTSKHHTRDRDRHAQARPSRHQESRRRKSVGRRPSSPDETDHAPPVKHPSALLSQPVVMHPFGRLASTVQQCPWQLGSDVDPTAARARAQALGGDLFYPPVPRSMMHDAAVSFVVTDHTRPEQPRFVISCPLEHVDLVERLLAPTGSHRVLSARGSSGHPRQGDQLRSMLLDGTPNIELAIHVGGGHASGSGILGGGSGGGSQPGKLDGTASSSVDVGRETSAEAGGVLRPAFVPMTWIPSAPMPPPGWYGGSFSEDHGMPYAPSPMGNP